MQNSFAVTCSNCGGVTKVEYTGEPKPQDLVCKFCGAPLKLPGQSARVTSPDALREAALHVMEAVEKVVEEHADGTVQGPVVIQPPQVFQTEFEIQTASAAAAKKAGCVIGGVSLVSCLAFLILAAGIIAIILLSAGQDLNKAVRGIRNALGTNTIDVRRTLKGDLWTRALAYSPDGRLIASATTDQITIWDVQSGAKVVEIPGTIFSDMLVFTPDSKQLLANNGSDLVFYSTTSGQALQTLSCTCSVFNLSPNGEMIITRNYNEQTTLWQVSSGTVIRVFEAADLYINHLLFSPDGHFVVAGSSSSDLVAWDVATGKKIFEGSSNATSTNLIAFHPTQNTLVVARDNDLEFYEVDDRGLSFTKSQTVNEDFFDIQGIAFSPDGKELALGNFFGDVWVWNIADKDVAYKLKEQNGIHMVAYSPDGSFVIGADSSGNIYEWQLHDQPATVDTPTIVPPPDTPAARTPTPLAAATCSIRPTALAANVRSGPGTNYGVAGKLANQASADGQQTDTDGFIWWRLADGSGWVRGDVVETTGACDQLPQVQ